MQADAERVAIHFLFLLRHLVELGQHFLHFLLGEAELLGQHLRLLRERLSLRQAAFFVAHGGVFSYVVI